MSPVNDPQSFKSGGGGRLLGLRESNQALAELKTKLEFALSRLNDQDTQRTGIEEIREFLQTLYPDWFPMVISCIGEAGTNLKPLGRCESVKLLGLLAELHGDAVVPLLARILQVVVTRLQDADLHLREACAETVFRLARSLVVDVESAGVFGTLLKPLFGALGEHSKWVQIGAAACICSVIQGSPPSVVRDNLGRLCSRLVQHLSLPLAMAKPQLLGACIYAMEAVTGADFDEVLPSLLPCLESCLSASSDWQTRKQAIEVLQTIGDNPELGQSLDLPPVSNTPGPTPLQRRIALLLEVVRTDKVRAVREAVKDVMLRWAVTKAPGPTVVRSSSPTASAAWQAEAREALLQRQGNSGGTRSSSPIAGSAWLDREQVPRGLGDSPGMQFQPSAYAMGGNAGARQNRSVRASTREREEDVTVLVPPERAKASTEAALGSGEKTDAASEKARAIKAALSGAALNSTKKPRPKRERQSIFSGPANASFFKAPIAGQPGPSGSVGGGEDIGEDLDGGAEEDEEEDLAREMQAAQFGVKASSMGDERLPVQEIDDYTGELSDASPQSEDEAFIGSSRAAGERATPTLQSDDIELQPPPVEAELTIATPVDATRAPSASRPQSDQRSVQRGRAAPKVAMEDLDVEVGTGSVEVPGEVPVQAASLAVASARRAGAEAWARAPPASDGPIPQAPPAASAELLEQLAERLQTMEEEKHESEERLLNALHSLESACESQNETVLAQGRQLELTERRLQLQEQQSRHQEQRVQQQEQQLRQQEEGLHEQELQIQQLEEQFDENNQLLREHEQQMLQQEQLIERQNSLINELRATTNSTGRPAGSRSEDQVARPASAHHAAPIDSASRPTNATPTSVQPTVAASPALPMAAAGESERPKASASFADLIASGEQQRPVTTASLRESLMQANSDSELAAEKLRRENQALREAPLDAGTSLGSGGAAQTMAKAGQAKKANGPLWEKVIELCDEQRFLEAYKQVIAEPEETCLLRLMQHTGPIVEQLDAESNSRLIRRLIHILSSPKEPASSCIEQVFSWIWQALEVGIHFTSSQVEDLAAALQKASAPHSFRERAEAAQLLSRVSALRRS